MSKFQEKLAAEGYCDSRCAGFCATATSLPNGEYGAVLLCVKGHTLNIYDIDIKSNVGALLYQIDLKKISGLKIKAGFLSQYLKFNHLNFGYSFTNFVGVKPALKVIAEEAAKR